MGHKRPSNWQTLPIRDLYLAMFDGVHGTPKPANDGPIFLGIRNVKDDGHFDLTDIRHIDEEDFPRWTKRVEPHAGDIVFSYEATLNLYGIIPDGFRGCLGRRLALIRPNPDRVDTRFLFYYFFGREWRKTIQKNMLEGATVQRIPISKFPEFPVTIPPLESQRRIASILSSYDDLIGNNTRRIKILEEMAKLIYREWFVQFEAPGIKLRKASPEEKKVTGKDVFPLRWRLMNVGALVTIQKGKKVESTHAEQVKGTLPLLLLDGIESGNYLYTYVDKKTLAKESDIVMVMDGARSGLVFIGLNGMLGSTLAYFRVTDLNNCSPYLVFLFLQSNFEIIARKNIGAAIPHANKDFIGRMNICLPSPELNEEAHEMFQDLFKLIGSLKAKNHNLRQTRDLLLPKLVSGEVEV